MKLSALILALGVLGIAAVAAPVVTFTQKPSALQLYPRDATDSGTVVIAGRVVGLGYDSIVVAVKKANVAYARPKVLLTYVNDTAAFSITVRIISELSEYIFDIYGNTTRVNGASNVTCGDVWVIDGQSNAEAASSASFSGGEWLRSAGYAQLTPGGASYGTWGLVTLNCCRSPGVGMVGANLGKLLVQKYNTPVCIINGAVSGTLIEAHQRNNSKPTDTTTIYGRILLRAQVSGLLNSVRNILYYQGEYHTDAASYAGLFDRMYKSWKSDYPALKKVYVMQVNAGCNEGGAYNAEVREIQRKFGDTYSDVTVMTAVGITGFTGCHYSDNGYAQTAEWWAGVYGRDYYGDPTPNVTAPRLLGAAYTSTSHTALDLIFDMPLPAPSVSTVNSAVTIGSSGGLVSSVTVTGNTLRLNLSGASNATTVTYVPANSYMGPYLYSARGVGVVTFRNYPIGANNSVEQSAIGQAGLQSLSVFPNPCNASGKVSITLSGNTDASVKVYDMRGNLIRTLSSNRMNWYMTGDRGNRVAAGIYIVRLMQGGREVMNQRLVVVR